jgi:hypothetical protein
MDLGRPHDASVSQRRRLVPISPQQLAQRVNVLFNPECRPECTILRKAEQRVRCPPETRQKMHRLGHDRFADEKRCLEFVDVRGGPAVVSLASVQKSDERPVSTIASIAAEAREMFGVRSEIEETGSDHTACRARQL